MDRGTSRCGACGVQSLLGTVLVAYGGSNTIVALAVLAGVVRREGGYDAGAMMGHAYLWDPLFFLWGGALVVSLRLSRQTSRGDR